MQKSKMVTTKNPSQADDLHVYWCRRQSFI